MVVHIEKAVHIAVQVGRIVIILALATADIITAAYRAVDIVEVLHTVFTDIKLKA